MPGWNITSTLSIYARYRTVFAACIVFALSISYFTRYACLSLFHASILRLGIALISSLFTHWIHKHRLEYVGDKRCYHLVGISLNWEYKRWIDGIRLKSDLILTIRRINRNCWPGPNWLALTDLHAHLVRKSLFV